MTLLAYIVTALTAISWIWWALDRHYDRLMYSSDKKIRPIMWSILAVIMLQFS